MTIESAHSRSGANNSNTTSPATDRDLFEKKMETDVLRFFQSTCVAKELITQKTIPNGKSASFPVVGNASAFYHTVGTEIEGSAVKSTERVIEIDDMLVSNVYVGDIDEAMVHYDANSAYNESIGRALATRYDRDALRMVAKAALIANSTHALAAGLLPFGDDIYNAPVPMDAANDELDGQKLFAKLAIIIAQWEQLDVVGEPVILLQPTQYYAFLNNPANTGLTWVNDEFAQSGKVPLILGKRVMKSPHIPTTDDSANSSIKAKYRADFSKVVGLVFSKEAVGCLSLVGLQMRSDYIPTRLSTLIVGKMAVGFGILNHSAAVALLKAP